MGRKIYITDYCQRFFVPNGIKKDLSCYYLQKNPVRARVKRGS